MSLPTRNLTLIGMMGVGKTTVGRHLARRLGRAFVDTDRIIVGEAGATIAEIFEREGEEGFRAREAAVVQRVAAVPHQVIAVGGGAVMMPANLAALRASGDVVLLEAPVTALARRVRRAQHDGARPLVAGADGLVETVAQLEQIWAERGAVYRQACDHRVDSGHRPGRAVADEIVEWLEGRAGARR